VKLHGECELKLSTLKDILKAIEAEKEKVEKQVVGMKKTEQDVRASVQMLQLQMGTETKAYEEVKKSLAATTEEENSLKESGSRLKVILSQSRQKLDILQAEILESRAVSEREKRQLTELKGRRQTMEADLTALEKDYKLAKQQLADENEKLRQGQSTVSRCNDEISRAQKELYTLQSKVREGKNEDSRREEEFLRKEKEAMGVQQRVRTETENLSGIVGEEKSRLNRLREENRDLIIEFRRTQEELRVLQADYHSLSVNTETARAQLQELESVKEILNTEITRLRLEYKSEQQRVECVDDAYNAINQRIKSLKLELLNVEQSVAGAKSMQREEESKLNVYQQETKKAANELSNIEQSIAQSSRAMHEEKSRAVAELGQLGQARETLKSNVFQLDEAQKRLQQ
jgi:chromosome segregation ATPase